jgi:hypothetical protein
MSEPTAPPAPSADPRWDRPYIARWRAEAAKHRERQTAATIDVNVEALISYLKEDVGVTHITEDLLYLLWATVPLLSTFIHARIAQTCGNPQQCGVNSLAHAVDGLEFGAASLLELESRIGQVIV